MSRSMPVPRPRSPRRATTRPPPLTAGLAYDEVQLPSRPHPRGSQPRQPRSAPRPLAPVIEREHSSATDSDSDYVYGRPPREIPYDTLSRSPSPYPHCTPWILNTQTINTTHRCSDAHFFRDPINVQPGEVGTVAIPILPHPDPFGIDVSIMTLTPTMYTPGAPFSELNWPLLAAQGFMKVDIHDGHVHNSTDGPALCNGRRPTRYTSTIRHRNMMDVDLLWCRYDADRSSRTILCTPAFGMVDMQSWADGVREGIVGRAADMNGRVAWTEPGEESPLAEILYGRPRL